jgi:hypothetical protein
LLFVSINEKPKSPSTDSGNKELRISVDEDKRDPQGCLLEKHDLLRSMTMACDIKQVCEDVDVGKVLYSDWSGESISPVRDFF